jgi:hypothetical protein
VLDSAAATAAPSLVISSPLPLPYLTLKNGESTTLNAELSGIGKTDGDESALVWQGSSGLSISGIGAAASVTATGTGYALETVTVTHPKAVYPLEITIARYDDEAQLLQNKNIIVVNRYHTLAKGAEATLLARITNSADGDALTWNVSRGLNSVISFVQESNSRATITARAAGTASVSVSYGSQNASFEITVLDDAILDPSKPCYLSTTQNVTTLDTGEAAELSILPVNLSAAYYDEIHWETADTNLIEIIPNREKARIRALAAGTALITVSHPRAENTLELRVHIGSHYVYKTENIAYISAPDTINLRTDGENMLIQPLLLHTQSAETGSSGFAFSIKDTAIAAIETGGASAIVSPRSAGQTAVVISHPQAAYQKEVLVIVNAPSHITPYITTNQNVVAVLQGEYTTVTASLANAESFSAGGWSWETRDRSVVSVIANNGATAMIAGNTPGTTILTVSNAQASKPLDIIVITVDRQSAESLPWIQTSANILTIKQGVSASVTAEMITGGSVNPAASSSFVWSSADSLTALISASQNAASIRGVQAGQTYITVRNTAYPDSYAKTVLIIVEDTIQDDCSISLSQQIVKLKPDDRQGVIIKASLINGEALDAQDFVWWADDYKIASLTSITDTAQIIPTGVSGATTVHVKHPKTLHTADIVVLVSAFETFAFASASVSVNPGGVSFIPMEVPALNGSYTISYESANTAVAVASGSDSVVMIAGISAGSTSIKARLSSGGGVIAESDLAVIVRQPPVSENTVTAAAALITIEYNASAAITAALSGNGITPDDKWGLVWMSSDADVVSVTANGADAVLSAKNPGETVISVSHAKCGTPFNIWVRVPDVKEKSLSLDQTFVQLYKNEGNVEISATIYNGTAADYAAITWSAHRQSGTQVVSLLNTSGRTCAIMPRAAGQTVLTAQLPDGKRAECAVSVVSDALLSISAQTAHVNPGYSETISYSVIPETASVSWFAQSSGNAASAGSLFDYTIDAVEKTITITGNSVGTGSISGYISSSAGAKMVTLQVIVEYNYSLFFTNAPYRASHRPDEGAFTYTFKVFPKNLRVETASSNPAVLSVPPTATVDPLTGIGSVTCTPLGEAANVSVSFTGYLPDSVDPIPVVSGERIADVMYDAYQFTPIFELQSGAYSRYENNRVALGDGEEIVFYLDVAESLASPRDVWIEWIPPDGNPPEDARAAPGGNKAGAGQMPASSGDGYIALSQDANGRFRIKHNADRTDSGNYFLITGDLIYDITIEKITYTYNHSNSSTTPLSTVTTTEAYTLNAKNKEGISKWSGN